MLQPVFALLLLASAAPAAEVQAEIDRALFDLCPKLIVGSLSLDDPAQRAEIGYAVGPKRGQIQYYQRAAGGDRVELSYSVLPSGKVCGIIFGGASVQQLFDGTVAAARRQGFDGGAPRILGGPSRALVLERQAEGLRLIFTQFTATTEDNEVVGFAFLSSSKD